MTVAITGATGVVGRAVLRHLIGNGHEVRALVHSDKALPAGVERAAGDVLDPDSLRGAFRGASTVYHVAGINEMCSVDPGLMERVNVEGTRNVANAAFEAGSLMVHTSSAAALGERPGEIGNERTVAAGSWPTRYAASKWRAEGVLQNLNHRQPIVIVNPSSVQGAGRATGTGRLLLALMRGRLRAVVDTRLSIVDIDDCAAGHLLAAERGQPGERYVLNSFSMTMQEAVSVIEAVRGKPLRVVYLPPPLLWVAGGIVGPVFRAARRRSALCPESVRVLLRGQWYDGSKASRDLGLEYTPADVTFRRLQEWAQEKGHL
jgi:dihydroflavonol-4-reductase